MASSERFLQELAAIISIGCGCASLCFESFRASGLEYHAELEDFVGGDWKTGMRYVGMLLGLVAAVAEGLKNLVVIALVSSLCNKSRIYEWW